MINIPLHEDGPDMDLVEQYVNNDEAVKGIWCVPLYSNPSGQCYSDEVVKRFANLKPAAKDFRIYWDNAYCVHHLYPDHPCHVLDIRKGHLPGRRNFCHRYLQGQHRGYQEADE